MVFTWAVSLKMLKLSVPDKSSKICNLTHCGLVTPYGDIDLGQHWLR